MSQRIEEVLIEGKTILKNAGIHTWSLDAEVLLAHILSFSRVQLFTHAKDEIKKEQQREYKEFLYKRVEGMPTQYLTHEQEFMSLPFYINHDVLIPRGDTEVLVETALDFIDQQKEIQVLDICTGSGCIGISIAYYAPLTKVTAVDISNPALKVAEYNARTNGVKDRVAFIKSNLFEKVSNEIKGNLDMIISNPPYIPTEDIKGLMKEVKNHEPNIALDGGEDGLDFYRIITEGSKEYLKSRGMLLFEIGYNQGEAVSEILKSQGFINIKVKKDLAGLDRVVLGIKE